LLRALLRERELSGTAAYHTKTLTAAKIVLYDLTSTTA
jgi:hypothetical protein